jgi:hypothetical protein
MDAQELKEIATTAIAAITNKNFFIFLKKLGTVIATGIPVP